MNYSLAYTLGKYRAGRTDPDASAYIAAVTTAGATVTSAQRTFIDNFYKAAKLDYYTSLKRLYLPIWGVAAANAIDMITRTSGTFNGGVTHGAGFVQGDRTTGYFDLGSTPSSLSVETGNSYIFALISQADSLTTSASFIGSVSGATNHLLSQRSSANLQGRESTVSTNATVAARLGILSQLATSTTNRIVRRRLASGVDIDITNTTSGTSALPVLNYFALARNNAGVANEFTDARIGSFGVGSSLSGSQDLTFTLHLKTLWEGCTGLTLP